MGRGERLVQLTRQIGSDALSKVSSLYSTFVCLQHSQECIAEEKGLPGEGVSTDLLLLWWLASNWQALSM